MAKTYLILILTTLIILAGCSSPIQVSVPTMPDVVVTGADKTQDGSATFKQISIQGSNQVRLRHGKTEHVAVESDSNLIPPSRVENGILYLGPAEDGSTMDYIVTYQTIEALTATGSSSIEFLEFNQDSLKVDLSGSATITLQGVLKNLISTNTGSSQLLASNVIAQNVTIEASGSSSLEIDAEQTLNVVLSGSAFATYKGNPQITQSLSLSTVLQKAQ